MRQRRTIEVSARVPPPRKSRGRIRLWAYGYADLAALFGMREGAVRMAARPRKLKDGRCTPARFDPTSLESVVAFAAERRSRR